MNNIYFDFNRGYVCGECAEDLGLVDLPEAENQDAECAICAFTEKCLVEASRAGRNAGPEGGLMPIDRKRCVRCNVEVGIFECEDAEYFEVFLLQEGIKPNETDVLCTECVEDIVKS